MPGRSCTLSFLLIFLLFPLAGWTTTIDLLTPQQHEQELATQIVEAYGHVTPDSLVSLHETWLELRKEVFGEESVQVGEVCTKWGRLLLDRGAYEEAEHLFKETLDIYAATYGPNAQELAEVYHNLGRVEEGKGNLKGAITWFERANGIYRLQSQRIVTTAPALLNQDMARAWYKLGELERSRELYEKALKLHRENLAGYVIHWYPVECLEALGRIAMESGANEEAAVLLDSALIEMRSEQYSSHEVTARIYLTQGDLYQRMGNYEAALTAYHQVLIGQVFDFNDSSVYVHPALPPFSRDLLVMEALSGKAKAFSSQYAGSQDPLDKHAALVCYKLAMNQLVILRRNVVGGDRRLNLLEISEGLFENAFQFCGQYLKQDPDLAATGLEFAERQKELQRWERLRGLSLSQVRGIPGEIIKQDAEFHFKQIRKSQALLWGSELGILTAEEQRELQDTLAEINRNYEDFSKSLWEEHPVVMDWLYGVRVRSTHTDFQRSLPDSRTLLLEFVWGEEEVYLFALGKEELRMQVIEKDAQFLADLALVIDMQSHLERGGEASERCPLYSDAAWRVFKELLEPQLIAFPLTERVLLVPDGALSALSFDALVTESPEVSFPHFGKLSWMVEKYSLQYVPSATQWRQLRGRSWSRAPEPLLALAPEYPDSLRPAETILSSLPKSGKSAERIALLTKGIAQLGSAATEADFKSRGNQYRILHLATDVIFQDSFPLQSHILMVPDEEEDGLFHAWECFQISLDADLVVLTHGKQSVPVTGAGKQAFFDGFSYAGSRAMVSNLWQGEETVDVELIESFFSHLETGMAKDVALQTAKLDYLRNADATESDPYYWASWVSQGDTVRIHQARVYRQWALGGGGLFLIFVAGILIARRYRKK